MVLFALISVVSVLFLLILLYVRVGEVLDVLYMIFGESEEETPDVHPQHVEVTDASEPSSDELKVWEEERASQRPSVLTDYELARLERESEFDLRISRMKEELAVQLPNVERKGTPAYEAPGIQNLPHTIIPGERFDDLPDVEISI